MSKVPPGVAGLFRGAHHLADKALRALGAAVAMLDAAWSNQWRRSGPRPHMREGEALRVSRPVFLVTLSPASAISDSHSSQSRTCLAILHRARRVDRDRHRGSQGHGCRSPQGTPGLVATPSSSRNDRHTDILGWHRGSLVISAAALALLDPGPDPSATACDVLSTVNTGDDPGRLASAAFSFYPSRRRLRALLRRS